MTKILLVDNQDSFTFNIFQYFMKLGCDVQVLTAVDVVLDKIDLGEFAGIVLSPGPGSPEKAFGSINILNASFNNLPVLGVCLGHQIIAQFFGAKITRAPRIMHGKVSLIKADKKGVFQGLPEQFKVSRYHSLIVDEGSLPHELEVSARSFTTDNQSEIMAIRHKQLPLEGVQFHPEAILSEHGLSLFDNFLNLCRK